MVRSSSLVALAFCCVASQSTALQMRDNVTKMRIPCPNFCHTKINPWSQKCNWKVCSTCTVCAEVSGAVCGEWCTEHPMDWSMKCSIAGCAGCADCHEGACTNFPPPKMWATNTCEGLKDKGHCNKQWLTPDGYCVETCGACGTHGDYEPMYICPDECREMPEDLDYYSWTMPSNFASHCDKPQCSGCFRCKTSPSWGYYHYMMKWNYYMYKYYETPTPAPMTRTLQTPAPPTPTPPTPTPPQAYVKEDGKSCGWGGGCTAAAQAYCYETSDPSVPYIENGYSKVMPNVARDEAGSVCGPVCSACDLCFGFTWIESLHDVENGCWFRQKPDCSVKDDPKRDCYTSSTYGR